MIFVTVYLDVGLLKIPRRKACRFDSGPGTSFEKAVSVKIQKRLFYLLSLPINFYAA